MQAHEAVAHKLGVPYSLPPPGPTVDGVVLESTPIESVAAGDCADVPLMIGACRDEMGLFLMSEDYFANADPSACQTTRSPLFLGPFGAAGRETLEQWLGPGAERVIDAYRRSRPNATDAQIEAAIRGDRQLLVPSLRFAEALAETGRRPIFVYSFDWVSQVLPQLGAFHNMDVEFFFSTTEEVAITRLDPSSARLATQMGDALIAFAHSSDPDHPGLPHWPRYDARKRATMIFGRSCHIANDPRAEELAAWRSTPTDRLGYDSNRRTRLRSLGPFRKVSHSESAHISAARSRVTKLG